MKAMLFLVCLAVAALGLLMWPGASSLPLAAGDPRAAQGVDLGKGDQGGGNKDLESLKGTWNIDAMEWGGKSLPKELLKGYKLVFAGNKLTWDAAIGIMSKSGKVTAIDGTFPCDFKIDPSKKPK